MWKLLLAMNVLVIGSAGLAAVPARSGCIPTFPYQKGWLGADGAYSIPLTATHDLWIFQDSLWA